MYTFVLVVHFIVCVLLILLVLMQSGKGSAAGIFGASGSDSLFGSPSAFNMLNKITAVLAACLFITSVSLTYLSDKRGASSAVDRVHVETPAPAQTDAE
ncbi:preprotein translocase subunit SecG [Parelusimicrobium proximum]|uniref:preprotein translocase subunit SecG n=1 Tax=Parelusimicrobium proximum TaxID=3228953 RepID=UPI003D16E5F3